MMLDQIFKKKKNSRLKNRRGASEIISTMMLMGITIVGAVILTYFVNDAFINGNLASASSLNSSSENIFLLAYDTRDSSSLLTLLDVDNLEIVLSPLPTATWNDDYYRTSEYKISLTTTKGNFFTTVASPFNT